MSQKILLVFVACGSLAAGLYFSGLLQQKVTIEARVFTPSRVIKPFTLIDQYQQPLNNDFFADHWTLVFLGYTHCPDVCPTTLSKLAHSYRQIKSMGIDNIQVLFVSVDPKRDDSARLQEYTAYFNPEFAAASAEHVHLYPFVRDLGLLYSMTEDSSLPDYAVSHSGSIVLVNPQGALHAMFQPQTPLGGIPTVDMTQLESDLAQMVKQF